jgi:magnesium chelatase family protein
MDYAKSYTSCINGLDTAKIIVEAHISNGIPAFNIVGLGDKAVSESKERIRAAFSSLNLGLPAKRITINLAPANLQKEGTHYDLPMALGILAAGKIINKNLLEKYIIHGELSLEGLINPTLGVLPSCIFANKLEKGFIGSISNSKEALISGHKNLVLGKDLLEIIRFFKGEINIVNQQINSEFYVKEDKDFAQIKGMNHVKRAAEVAIAGRHNMLMIGSPGTGKSMIAERLPSITPILNKAEILENCMIKSVAGKLNEDKIDISIPFRAPHHSASLVALTGGGKKVMPGEISLAHNGILFLDELPEFQKNALEALRQPLESKKINIARADRTVSYPANFQLIAAMNPCRCGYLQIPEKNCNIAPLCGKEYSKKISGPLLERIDIITHIPNHNFNLFTDNIDKPESSAQIKARIIKARILQQQNLKEFSLNFNSEISLELFENNIDIALVAKQTLNKAQDKFNLSVRNLLKILRVAKTIADLAASKQISNQHILEALSFKMPN